MSYLALYRQYRPTGFDGVIGQEPIIKTLVNQIESGRIGHAYLFTGTRGTGKTTVAKIFARAVNCEHPKNGSPCGECEVCKALADPSNLDILEIDAASNNGVSEIRELRDNVQFPPVASKYKVYIVDEVHMLSGAAFNALLKTLEEPPKHAIFILATTEVHKIPATILSRCMRFDFRLVPTERIAKLIADIYDKQGKKYQKEAVFAIARAGEGSVRDALSIADIALSYGEGELTYNDVMEIIGASDRGTLAKFAFDLLQGNAGGVLDMTDKLASLGKSMGMLIKDIIAYLRDILVVKTCVNAKEMLSLPKEEFDSLFELAKITNADRLLRTIEIFADAESDLRYSTRQRVVFERAAVKATRPDNDYNFDALLSRISSLEEKVNGGANGVSVVSTDTQKKTADIEQEGGREEKTVDTEKVVTEKIVEEEKKEKLRFADFTDTAIKGKLLGNLRHRGEDMLSCVMQNVGVKTKEGVLYLIPYNEEDKIILQEDSMTERIKEALSGFEEFSVIIKESEYKKEGEQIEGAIDEIKKIFGEDKVIIKE